MNAAILEQLSKLESVPENWESGGASPPNCTARVNARRVIELFLLAGCVPDNVDPSEGEGVCISLRRDDRYADIECFNDGKIVSLVSRDNTVDDSQLWYVEPGEMINAVQKIRQFFTTDETDEILADTDFADDLRESNKQADAGNTRPWEEIKDEIPTWVSC